MHKLATAALAILVLFLLAANARLENRRAALERRLAAAERPAGPTVATTPTLPEPPPVEPAPTVAPPPAASATPPPPPAPDSVKTPPRSVVTAAHAAVARMTFKIAGASGDEALGLTKEQKAIIDDLRRARDLQTGRHQEEIQAIDDRTEAAIRQVLTPEQLAKVDEQNKVDVVGPVALDVAPSNHGYLGVSGDDAEGGGARLDHIFEKSSASETGLQVDDVVLEVNGEKVAGYLDLAKKIQANPQGTPVVLRVRRGGAEFLHPVTLGPRR